MKKRHTLKVILMFAALAVLLFFFRTSPYKGADMGNFAGDSDYSSGSESSWSSGGGGYSGGWDSGYSSSPRIYVDGGSSSGIDTTRVLVFIFQILLFWVVLTVLLKIFGFHKGKRTAPAAGAQKTPIASLKPMGSYKELDPAFDEDKFRAKLSNLYVQMQNAWTDKKIESVRPYMTDALYAQFDRQLSALKQRHLTNYVDKIAVLDVSLDGWKQSGGEDQIIATIRTRITDYTVQDADGKIVSGSATAEKFMTYEWTLSRTTGEKTAEKSDVTTISCPHCGAPVNINETAKCPYCGSILTLKEHGFVVSAIKGISQRTVGR